MNLFFVLLIFGLASGRVTYSLVHDEIFRPIREWIWLRSAPEGGTIRYNTADGDIERPARMFHVLTHGDGTAIEPIMREYVPTEPMRKPGFFGKLTECVYCLGFWVSVPLALLYFYDAELAIKVALPFAVWSIGTIVSVKGL